MHTLEQGDLKLVVQDLGATVTHLYVKAANGRTYDVVAGCDTEAEYKALFDKQNPYFGCVVGRVCNRYAYHLIISLLTPYQYRQGRIRVAP